MRGNDMRNLLKMKMIRAFLLMLAFLLVFSFCACNDPGADALDSSSESIGEGGETEPETEAEAVKALDLVINSVCGYTIVRPEIMGDELEYEVMELKKAIGVLTRETPKIAEDWLNPFTNQQPEELEIIVGNCNREETKSVLKGLKYLDWTVEIVGKKLVIVGHSEETTLKAIEYFRQFLYGMQRGDDFIFTPEDCHTERAEYALDDVTVNGASLSEYSIVIPTLCSTAEKNAANELAGYLSKMTGYLVDVIKDNTEETANEILVGRTNRQASKDVLEDLRYQDSVFKIDGSKVVILGYIPENTVKLCGLFEDLVDREARKSMTVALSDEHGFEDRYRYEADAIILNGKNLKEYTIVYPNGNAVCQTVANNINRAIISKLGIALDVIADNNSKKTDFEILIGDTNRTYAFDGDGAEGQITVADGCVCIAGGDKGGFGKAVGRFIENVFPVGMKGTVEVELAAKESFFAETEDVKVMSYNILTWPTEERLQQIVTIIKDYAPDVIGMQEAVPYAVVSLKSLIGDTYDCVHLERDTGSGESTPIWYNKNKYNLVDSGSGWLSATPDTMSKLPKSEYYRVYVYVVLENKETGTRFVHVNTHLDFADAQQQQVSILLGQTAHLAYMPMFYTADWNFVPGDMGYKLMHNGGYVDTSVMTTNVHGSGTFVGSSSEIDFCFASVLNASVDSYRVVDDHEFSETSSDHYPIFVELKVTK